MSDESNDAQAGAAEAEAKPEPSKLQKLLLEYGVIGIIVLLSLSALTVVGFTAAFMFGFEVEGTAESAGVAAAVFAGWLATKPIRIPLAVVLTPIVAAVWHRIRGKKAPEAEEA